MFVSINPWQAFPALCLGKGRSLHYSGASERYFTWVGSDLTRNH